MNHQEGLVKCLILNPSTNHSVAALQYFWRVLLLSLVTTCMVAATAVRAMLYLAHLPLESAAGGGLTAAVS